MSSSLSDSELQLLRRVLEAIQLTRYTLLSCAFIIFYDYAISFDREVELIWRKRWSIIKAVFLWHRYFGIFCAVFELAVFMSSSVTDSFCAFLFLDHLSPLTTIQAISGSDGRHGAISQLWLRPKWCCSYGSSWCMAETFGYLLSWAFYCSVKLPPSRPYWLCPFQISMLRPT